MALKAALFSAFLAFTSFVAHAHAAPNPPDGWNGGNWDGGDWGDKDGDGRWGGGWGGMLPGSVCSGLNNDATATAAYSCFKSAISSLRSKSDDLVWSTCGPAMGMKSNTNDGSWTSCLCSWALGPQASCISSACGGNGLSSYVASVTSDLSCEGTPTDAPIIAAGAVEGNTAGDDKAPRETGAPAAIAAGVIGIAAMML